jgi:hypothetical protein
MDSQNVLGQSDWRGGQPVQAVVYTVHGSVPNIAMEAAVRSKIGKVVRLNLNSKDWDKPRRNEEHEEWFGAGLF